jgi:hypothetical protein
VLAIDAGGTGNAGHVGHVGHTVVDGVATLVHDPEMV